MLQMHLAEKMLLMAPCVPAFQSAIPFLVQLFRAVATSRAAVVSSAGFLARLFAPHLPQVSGSGFPGLAGCRAVSFERGRHREGKHLCEAEGRETETGTRRRTPSS